MFLFIHIRIHRYTCIYICISIYIYICLCIRIYIYVFIYVYTNTYTYTDPFSSKAVPYIALPADLTDLYFHHHTPPSPSSCYNSTRNGCDLLAGFRWG